MSSGKGMQQAQPRLFGLDQLNLPTNETNVPHTYFAGIAPLKASWICAPLITKEVPQSPNGKKGSGGGGKVGGSAPTTKTIYGNCAAVICQGQLDFIWGIMVNNNVAYPAAIPWDSRQWQSGQQFVWTDGNLYTAGANTNATPPSAPWAFVAGPYNSGTTYHNGDKVLGADNSLWQRTGGTSTGTAPQATKPTGVQFGAQSVGNRYSVTTPNPIVSGWKFLSKPPAWPGGGIHQANAIVSWLGELYITPSTTSVEPPASPWVRWSVQEGSSPNPLHITMPKGQGDLYLYWGTAAQTLDSSGEAFLTTFGHPAYRNRAVVVLKNFLFGQGNETPPDIVVLGGRAPKTSIITGGSTALDADWQANPWCVLDELLTDPIIGLGLPSSWFDQMTWQAEADFCAANSQLYYISPMVTSLTKVRDVVADILGYPDAFIFWSLVGTLMAGHWPHGQAAPAFTSATTINRDVLEEGSEIQADVDAWTDTTNSVELSFRDVQAAFNTRPVVAPNLFNRQVTRRIQAQKVERPHIVRYNQAMQWAQEMAKIAGDRGMKGTLKVRAERAASIVPGSLFELTDDVLGVSFACRCTGKTVSAPPAGTVEIVYELERGVSPVPYAPTGSAPPATAGATPSLITDFQVFQLPPGLNGGDPTALGVLLARTNAVTTDVQVWYNQADTALQLLTTAKAFAIKGSMQGMTGPTKVFLGITQGNTYDLGQTNIYGIAWARVDYDHDGLTDYTGGVGVDYIWDSVAGTITVLTGGSFTNGSDLYVTVTTQCALNLDPATPADDIEAISGTQTVDEFLDDTLMLIAFRYSDPTKFEIMSVKDVTLSSGTYLFTVIGQQFSTLKGGTGTYLWQGGGSPDYAFLVRKSDLPILTHESFAGLQKAGEVASFVLAPGTSGYQADPTNLYDPNNNPGGLSTSCGYTFNNPFAPSVAWVMQLKNGSVITDLTVEFLITDVFEFTFSVNDAQGDFQNASLIAFSGDQQIILWAGTFPQTSAQSIRVKFSLPAGFWGIKVFVSDANGNGATKLLTLPGDNTVRQMNVQTSSGNAATVPVAENWSYTPLVFTIYVTGLQFAAAISDTVSWQIQPLGTAYNPSGWTTIAVSGGVTGFIAPFQAGTYTLYAKASKSGRSDSAVASWNL